MNKKLLTVWQMPDEPTIFRKIGNRCLESISKTLAITCAMIIAIFAQISIASAANEFGLAQQGNDRVVFYVNTNDWADVHFRLNSAGQQNHRMQQTNGRNEWVLTNLSVGDSISYSFTYQKTNGAVNTATSQYTISATGPADSDNDGVADDKDVCPNTPGGTPVDAKGCPITVSYDVDGKTRIEAEDYNRFHDTTATNIPGQYRQDAVDIEATTDANNGFNVGYIDSGEWLEFDLTFRGGQYDLSTRVSSAVGSGAYQWLLDGQIIGAGTVGNTGGWQSFETQKISAIRISEGAHKVRIYMSSGLFNVNWFEFDPSATCEDPSCRDSDNDGVTDDKDQCPNTRPGAPVNAVGCEVLSSTIIPLYDASTPLEAAIVYDRGDALVTRISDRGRDRHAKENHFQAYDHFLTFYWEQRTASIEIIDYVAKGGSSIRMNVKTLTKLDDLQAENRWWYIGLNTLAEYCGNGVMATNDNRNYWKEESWNCRENRPIQIGDKLEFEISQFLDASTLNRGRSNYYGTTYLYIVGEGIVPWDVTDKEVFQGGKKFQRDSIPIPESARMGGDTTLHVQMTAEPDGHFQQMATNLSYDNGQAWVLGRRVHHSSMEDGTHDEATENGVFNNLVGLTGTHYISERCTNCHERNGRAVPPGLGEPLEKWVFKVGDANGNKHADLGRVLQPKANGGAASEGIASLTSWTFSNGLRSPNYRFSRTTPPTFSARIAPALNGLGLLEAIPESAILALADENDANGDGISGRAAHVTDPKTGDNRLGRFGYKAATSSLTHQISAALNTDMGVMTSVLPTPDCGSNQTDCGPQGKELNDEHLRNLVKYVSLLGVRPQRDYNNAEVIRGKQLFASTGCNACHVETFQTSQYHPLAELRSQTIHPYTDLLLHDMGPGLADNLGEGTANGAEWRTAPLWGVGLSACVTGGVEGPRGWDAFGLDGYEKCTPEHGYLHDGRARTLDEAIRWHGGEGESSKNNYEALNNADKNALIRFIESL
ncbi:di-heme oxidoredictase family protein [Reinekea sp. G2M2-21]|uniref:di-heme oxidoredictase family protein n=1 Tax=Reinekea sp. G2M2-21 TaxID=2788942 RepID=UPI001E2E90BC|nr:di-heme oxidoredictase family protein [Reinekea sp. G2M2-21]